LLARDREVRNLPPLPQYVETLFLKRLDDLAGQLPKEGLEWTAATATAVQRAIRLVRDGERVAAGDPGLAGAWDPRAFPWIRTALDQAAQKRHDAEARLFAPGFASPARADQLLQEAADDCQAVRADLETVHAAYRALDEALVRLPGLLPYLMNPPDLEPSDERDWKDAVQAASDLEGLLANPPASGAGDVGRLKTPAATLQSALRRL